MDNYLIIDIEHHFDICLEKSTHYEEYDKKNDQITLTIDQLKTIVETALFIEYQQNYGVFS